MTDTVRVAFLLFPGVTQLDLTGPAQVLSRLKGAKIDLVAKNTRSGDDRRRLRDRADRDVR